MVRTLTAISMVRDNAEGPPAIERLIDPAPGSFDALVAESERAGYRFVRRLAEEWTSGANRFDRPGEALFASLIDGRMIGICGLNVDPYTTTAGVGRVRHLYVLVAYRRLGIGRQLVGRVVEAARGRFDRLRLSTQNPAAARLYERLGFDRRAGATDHTHLLELH
jgi:GNAT superfamily N-acetyltransferase